MREPMTSRRNSILWLAAVSGAVLAGSAVGCFNPDYPEGRPCGVNAFCPPGQTCSVNNRCFNETSDKQADAGGLGQDGGLNECDPVAQNCLFGGRCAFVLDNSSTGQGHFGCTSDPGSARLEEGCTFPQFAGETDTCRAGLSCAFGLCLLFCDGFCPDYNFDGRAETCFAYSTGQQLCQPSCNVFEQNCPDGYGCYVLNERETICFGSSFFGRDAQCTFANDCAPGLTCVTFNNASQCRAFCNVAIFPDQQAPECFPGEICRAINGAPPDVGFCAL
jgi:hypothetical protein